MSASRAGSAPTDCWLLDLDGVLWRDDEPIAGAAAGVERLRRSGLRVAFFTNNSFPTLAEQVAKLVAMGVEASKEEVLTSAQAAATLVEPGERALVVGGPGLGEALRERDAEVVFAAEADGRSWDVVVAGIDPSFDYARLDVAARAVRAGARLVGTNDDSTFPTPQGLRPGAGSLLAAISYAAGRAPVVAGKPNEAAAHLVASRLGKVGTVVGDRPETDGGFARRLGAKFALVLSGVTSSVDPPSEPLPDRVAADLGMLALASTAGQG